jgi:TPR repeat protein
LRPRQTRQGLHRALLALALSAPALPALALAPPTPLATLEARAAQADGDASVELGLRLQHGEGVPRDIARATLLYCRAAERGHAGATYQLALMRLYGRGVERDDGYALSWLGKAAAAGNVNAGRLLERIHGEARPDSALCPPPEPVVRPPIPPKEIAKAVNKMAPRFGLDPALVTAVIAVESGFQSDAVSPKNAQGLMQLIPETAARFGVADSFDPEQNLRGGMSYLRWLLKRFDGDVTLAVAAYNAGENAVLQHGGVPPYPETQDYVAKIRHYYGRRHHPIATP